MKDLNSKLSGSVDGPIGVDPLVLELALADGALKGGDSHDEVINKLDGYDFEASVDIIVIFFIDDVVYL